jgi:hypothetical protein
VDTPRESLQDLDVARRCAAIVPIVCLLGHSGHYSIHVELQNLVIDVDGRVRRGGFVQQRGVFLRGDDRFGEALDGRERVLVWTRVPARFGWWCVSVDALTR